jgi:anti-sigma factor ChrR (cupin superfamily)
LELKELDNWPKRTTTTIKIPSLTIDQVLFLERWQASGGSAHLLLQVERTYLLLKTSTVRAIWATSATRGELEAQAVVKGEIRLPTLQLVRALTRSEDA